MLRNTRRSISRIGPTRATLSQRTAKLCRSSVGMNQRCASSLVSTGFQNQSVAAGHPIIFHGFHSCSHTPDLAKSDRNGQTSSPSDQQPQLRSAQRVWHAQDGPATDFSHWEDRVIDTEASNQNQLHELIKRIEDQELSGGRLRQRRWGVLHQDPATDMQLLTDNYTVKAVASALRDREDALQTAAILADQGKWEDLAKKLQVHHPRHVLARRYGRSVVHRGSAEDVEAAKDDGKDDDVTKSLCRANLELLRKSLMRMPRTVTQGHNKRAGVVVALGTCEGVPCVLLEKRARHLRAHPDEVCLPGGMVCDMQDTSIVSTCLREMREEIGGLEGREPDVLGVLRCNWGEIHHLVNVAVTPVVCYWGELPAGLKPSADEVAQVFTVPLASLLDTSLWVRRDGLAPIFVGGPEVIWGLCGYILERFTKDILMPNSSRHVPEEDMFVEDRDLDPF